MTILLLTLITALSLWDVHTTSDGLKHGYARESTPWLGWLNRLHEDGVFWVLVAMKAVVVAGLWIWRDDSAAAVAVYTALFLIYAWFVGRGNTKLWYFHHFKKHK